MNTKSRFLNAVLVLLVVFAGMQSFAQSTTIADSDETEIQDTPDSAAEPIVKEVVVNDDELPSESVTPNTDNSSSVLNKKIKFTKKFQIDLYTGSVLDEPIVNSSYFLIRGSYYTTEEYSFGLGLRSRFGGRTSYSDQLFQGTAQLNFDRAPSPSTAHFVSFAYNFYYGKISLGKNVVVPASTRLESDFGLQSFGSSSKPFIQSAVNQSFFIGTKLSIGFSIGLSLAQIADPTSVNVRSAQPVPSEGAFSDKMQFNQYLSVNLSTLL